MRALLLSKVPLSFLVATVTSGCNIYYESKAEDMVERHMRAMVHVEGGGFMMGNPGGWSVRSDTTPVHHVVLDDFYIQKYEVTQGDFELFIAHTGYKPSDNRYDKMREDLPARFADELPAVASWRDANAFCQWLGEQTDLTTGLPTEAQWEFAARARGRMIQYATSTGQAIPNKNIAPGPTPYNTHDGHPSNDQLPSKPGAFPPNPIGLHDMSGNVMEWVSDNYSEDYYQNSAVNNPTGPAEGQKDIFEGQPYRVLRGGHFKEFRGNTTVTRQKGSEPLASETRGFRCARS